MGNNPIQSLVFAPPDPPVYTERFPRKVTYILTKSEKRIPIYYIPVHEKFLKDDVKEIKTTVLYSHGNASDLGSNHDFLVYLHENCAVNILHYEYVGYGLGGLGDIQPSEELVYESIEAAYEYLQVTKKLEDEDIILWGTSLGSGPTCEMGQRGIRFKGIILECAFKSCCRVVTNKISIVSEVLEKANIDMFVNIKKVEYFLSPTMMFHGEKDQVVPFTHGEELWKSVPRKCKFRNVWVRDAGHDDIQFTMGERDYFKQVDDFIEYCEEVNKKGGLKIERKLKTSGFSSVGSVMGTGGDEDDDKNEKFKNVSLSYDY